VVFAAGGFSKNAAMLDRHFSGDRELTGGGCAVTTASGDLVAIAERHGFMLEFMDEAWFIENVYEQYKKDPDSVITPNYLAFQAYWLNGDSMIVANRRGIRVFNEKTNYDDRTRVHFHPDNRFLFSVFDQHTLEHFPGFGGHVTPAVDTIIGPAGSPAELEGQLRSRLQLDPATAAFGLAEGFADQLASTISRFNGFARNGKDLDFGRGETSIDLWWHAFCLTFQGVNANAAGVGVQDCLSANVDENGQPYPNVTMRPLEPPYYAVILSSGLQDTKGGAAIDEHGRILDRKGRPVAGLYGAGNCIASPAGAGYWGAGGTLGPAVVFGHIAGRHAASRVPAVTPT
jgi:3-oxosteroid 1-dehydrogenase